MYFFLSVALVTKPYISSLKDTSCTLLTEPDLFVYNVLALLLTLKNVKIDQCLTENTQLSFYIIIEP